MKFITITIAVLLPVTVLAANPVANTDNISKRIDAQDKRIDDLAKKVDQMLTILKNISPKTETTPANTTTKLTSAPKSTKTTLASTSKVKSTKIIYAPNPLLDIYVMEPAANGKFDNLDRPDASYGTMVDKSPLFNLAAFMKDSAFKDLKGQAVGHHWYGLLKINDNGKHVLSYEFNSKKSKVAHRYRFDKCNTKVSLEGQELFFLNQPLRIAKSIIKSKSLELEKGYYKLSVWTACSPNYTAANIASKLKIRGPKDRTAKQIDGKLFQHEK